MKEIFPVLVIEYGLMEVDLLEVTEEVKVLHVGLHATSYVSL